MKKFLNIFFKAFVVISIILLTIAYFSLSFKINNTQSNLYTLENPASNTISDQCGSACKAEIKNSVAEALATISALPQSPKASPVAAIAKNTIYIPVGNLFSTQSTDWVDVPASDIWLDFKGDYGQKAYASWDVFLKVENANGQAFARLIDVTHGITVNGSELSTVNNDTFKQVTSNSLSLWNGRNLYRVQIKSLNSFPVYFNSGRIKIIY